MFRTDHFPLSQHKFSFILHLQKNSFSFFFSAGFGSGILGCNKLKPESFAIAICASWSTTILLWDRNRCPKITGEQSESATTAWMACHFQPPEGSLNCNFTHWHMNNLFFAFSRHSHFNRHWCVQFSLFEFEFRGKAITYKYGVSTMVHQHIKNDREFIFGPTDRTFLVQVWHCQQCQFLAWCH